MSYKRLTNEELNDFTSRVVVQLEPTLTQQVMSLILELTEYRNKIENGTLVELPCKVGDTVYVLEDIGIQILPELKEFVIYRIDIVINEKYGVTRYFSAITKNNYTIEIDEDYFGKSVFLTKAEAEKKLEELSKNP